MRLIDNAGSLWHRFWSLRLAILTTIFGSITAAYLTLPSDWLPSIPAWLKEAVSYGTILTAIFSGVSRVIKQPGLPP